MNKSKFRNRSIFHFHFVSVLILFPLLIVSFSQQAHAAGGGGGTITGGTDTPTTSLTNTGTNSVQPLNQTNPISNGFSYSQQFSGYGVTNGCGTQLSIGTNYGNSNSPYSTTTDSITTINNVNTRGYTIGANLIFNSQPCTDPSKTLQIQQDQILVQKTIACNQERGKLAALILTQNPKATAGEIREKIDVVCK